MDANPPKSDVDSGVMFPYRWVYLLTMILMLIGWLLAGCGFFGMMQQNRDFVIWALSFGFGISFIALATALKLLRDIASKLIYGLNPGC